MIKTFGMPLSFKGKDIMIVPKDYEINTKTEFFVKEGFDLKNGMIVLPANPEDRVGLSEESEESWDDAVDRAMMHNRWCNVTQMRVLSVPNEPDRIAFVGVYEDLSVRQWDVPCTFPWLVKRNNPQSEAEETSFVPKYFVMDPATDDLLFDGTFLEEGMVVLIASSDRREEIGWREASSTSDPKLIEKMRKYNRWCTVSNVQIGGPHYSNEMVLFIGTYDDGTKAKFSEHISHPWYVKKDSIWEETEQ